jgi:hypothetical protein
MNCPQLEYSPIFGFPKSPATFDPNGYPSIRNYSKASPPSFCESIGVRPLLLKPPEGPSLQKSVRLFAPATSNASIIGVPKSPFAKILYDLTTQLKDFEMTVSVKIPVEGLNKNGPVQTVTKAILKNQGAIVLLGVEFKPFVGPTSLKEPFDKIPVLGQFFKVRILRLFMDPKSRQLKTRVEYLFIPFNREIHRDLLKKVQLAPAITRGPGYDFEKGLPIYTWQMADLIQKILKEQGEGGLRKMFQSMGLDAIVPLLEQGEIQVKGNFSNRTIMVGGIRANFSSLPPGQEHLITVGNLLKPVTKIWGLHSAEIPHPKGTLRFAAAEDGLEPLEIQTHIEPKGNAIAFMIPRYKSKRVFIEAELPERSDLKLRATLEEGIEIRGMTLRIDSSGPRIHIRQLIAKKTAFDGLGVQFRSTSGDQAIFEDVHLATKNGKLRFFSNITGKATGEINYSSLKEELGYLKFENLKGNGRVLIEPDLNGKTRVQIAGNLSTEMPKIRFLVRSEKMKSFVLTEITDAKVSGKGRLKIWPEDHRVHVESLGTSEAVSVRGRAGIIRFHQDASEVEKWPELKKNLGLLASKVATDFFILPKKISFDVTRMKLKSSNHPQNGKPALEIEEADLGPIQIVGDAHGLLFVRLPWGAPFPILIRKEAMMKDAVVELGRLKDERTKNSHRAVEFNQIKIGGMESLPTFSKRDQKRCEIDRQHIHATLGLFMFSPDERKLRIEQVDPHFHIYLKHPVWGGCLKIE